MPELCAECRGYYGVTGLDRDCKNCEGYRSCKWWLWGGRDLRDTKENAEECPCFWLMGSHQTLTCKRGFNAI